VRSSVCVSAGSTLPGFQEFLDFCVLARGRDGFDARPKRIRVHQSTSRFRWLPTTSSSVGGSTSSPTTPTYRGRRQMREWQLIRIPASGCNGPIPFAAKRWGSGR